MTTNRTTFDFDLAYGEAFEACVRDFFTGQGGKFEVKTERGQWISSGNIAIEVRCNGRPSGLSVTEADWWVHVLADGDRMLGMLVFPVSELRDAVLGMLERSEIGIVSGGDGGVSVMALVPMRSLHKLFAWPFVGHINTND